MGGQRKQPTQKPACNALDQACVGYPPQNRLIFINFSFHIEKMILLELNVNHSLPRNL